MAAEHVERMGARIRELRERAGLTQKDLAELIPGKTDSSQVSKWERGENRPLDNTLEHIARALNCDVGVFHAPDPEEPESPDLMTALGAQGSVARLEERLERIENALDELLAQASEQEIEEEASPGAPRERGDEEDDDESQAKRV